MALTSDAIGQNAPRSSNLQVTNLLQLVQLLNGSERVVRDVRLDATVCAASDPRIGVVILQDATDTELVELGSGEAEVSPGDRIRIERNNCLLRRRDMGVQISASPVVDNDGLHAKQTIPGRISLKAGRYPLTLEWFNQSHDNPSHDSFLEVTWQASNSPPKKIPASVLCYGVPDENAVEKVFHSGLKVESFEGNWEQVPDFDLLKPSKTGVSADFDLKFRAQNEFVGLRFRGFLDAPADGVYRFATRSADGSLLFIGDPGTLITRMGQDTVPQPKPSQIGEAISDANKQQWGSIEGRVDAISPAGRGLELKLYSQGHVALVRIADAIGLDITNLSNSQIRVVGVGSGIFNFGEGIVLGRVFVANTNGVEILNKQNSSRQSSSALINVKEIQNLSLEEAKRHLPVYIRGVVTSVGRTFDHWLSIQDDTRGIFVDLHAISNGIPVPGDFYEINGHSSAGDFAPIVEADQIVRLGKSEMPELARPTWDELINGSMDVQWVEFHGLVTAVHTNVLSMLLPNGQIDVQVEQWAISKLLPLKNSVIRIHGVFYASWNTNREVEAGKGVMRNSSISVDIPAPADPFDAILKTPRELLLFDAQASPFRRVKVRGQIVYADKTQLFLTEDGLGLHLLPTEQVTAQPGDLVEAVGYLDISRTALLLREVVLRKTGVAPLVAAKKLTESELMQESLDSTRVQVQGKLLGWHTEHGSPVLEMQSGEHLYLARLKPEGDAYLSLRLGSRLALAGVYVKRGHDQDLIAGAESFDLLLNSPADILVISQPPWWTLQRLLILVGALLLVLVFTAIWIKQLRRLVEQRTTQLQREIHERERVEHEHALEAERSRIARDLHDDLGSSLTEISTLARTGQYPQPGESIPGNLFQTIAGKARELVVALDVIVWAVDPEDNSLQSLADYLSEYTDDFFSHTNIFCRFKVPVSFPKIVLEGRVRHELLMAVKEALNNVVRHADATEVEFRMVVSGSDLEIEIADNGKGFEVGHHDGHGLKNLSARLIKLAGSFAVESRIGGGTTAKIRLPLAVKAETDIKPGKG
jgi:signal transduction histidine kinase